MQGAIAHLYLNEKLIAQIQDLSLSALSELHEVSADFGAVTELEDWLEGKRD